MPKQVENEVNFAFEEKWGVAAPAFHGLAIEKIEPDTFEERACHAQLLADEIGTIQIWLG
ncbi:hypothetical protein N8940_01020 [Sphingomonadaceae bacterium]|nr:hypothetical protein [Sphingomonadaceae bacterium]